MPRTAEKRPVLVPPPDDWKPVSIRMSTGILDAIDLYMASHGMRDRSELVREAISTFITYKPSIEELEAELRRIQSARVKKS